jgi:hypothetical protein
MVWIGDTIIPKRCQLTDLLFKGQPGHKTHLKPNKNLQINKENNNFIWKKKFIRLD